MIFNQTSPDPRQADRGKQKDCCTAGLQNSPGVAVACSGSADPGNPAASTSTSAASTTTPAHNRTPGNSREEVSAQQSCPGTLPASDRTEVGAKQAKAA